MGRGRGVGRCAGICRYLRDWHTAADSTGHPERALGRSIRNCMWIRCSSSGKHRSRLIGLAIRRTTGRAWARAEFQRREYGGATALSAKMRSRSYSCCAAHRFHPLRFLTMLLADAQKRTFLAALNSESPQVR
jgi:hypothetical protein